MFPRFLKILNEPFCSEFQGQRRSVTRSVQSLLTILVINCGPPTLVGSRRLGQVGRRRVDLVSLHEEGRLEALLNLARVANVGGKGAVGGGRRRGGGRCRCRSSGRSRSGLLTRLKWRGSHQAGSDNQGEKGPAEHGGCDGGGKGRLEHQVSKVRLLALYDCCKALIGSDALFARSFVLLDAKSSEHYPFCALAFCSYSRAQGYCRRFAIFYPPRQSIRNVPSE